MIERICAFIHNYFHGDRYAGTFTIENGAIEVPGLVTGQYFQICGSRLNDGVYQYGLDELTDETFDGVIWDMRPPKAFLAVVDEITAWNDKYGEVAMGPYSSESFGGYSYTKAQSYANAGGGMQSTWQSVFAPYLNQWRKLC
jgi:hypothetical protein